jgi:hypothetical protein
VIGKNRSSLGEEDRIQRMRSAPKMLACIILGVGDVHRSGRPSCLLMHARTNRSLCCRVTASLFVQTAGPLVSCRTRENVHSLFVTKSVSIQTESVERLSTC